jgi:hypothetical protein
VNNAFNGEVEVEEAPNTPPTVQIHTPADSAFYAVGDTIWLHGTVGDAEDPVESLVYGFESDRHHGGEMQPGPAVADSAGFFLAESYGDDIGVWYEVRLLATDTGDMTASTSVVLLPEIDLSPGAFSIDRSRWVEGDTVTISFKLHNAGGMPAPASRWRLVADGTQVLAEGDTLVGALDSVTVSRTLLPTLAAGLHDLRIVADTLGAVAETSEVNNGFSGVVDIESEAVGVPGEVPGSLALGIPYPNPSAGQVRLQLALPRAARVSFAVHDLQGREVWRMPDQALDPGRVSLAWPARSAEGSRVSPGVYLARVLVYDDGVAAPRQALVRRIVILR